MTPCREDENIDEPIPRTQSYPRTDLMPEIALAPTIDLEQELSMASTSSTEPSRRTQSSSDVRYRHPTIGRRLEEHRLQHVHTVGSSTPRVATRQDTQALPSFGRGRPYPKPLPEREEYVVDFDDAHDPDHPQNWPLKRKLWITAILVFDSLAATLASSIYSPATTAVETHFDIGRETATLGTSLFVLGYAFGPVCWAPLSELYGRRMPIITAAFGFAVFQIAVAVAKDTQTFMVCRFFAGWMGACTLTLCPAVFADMYDNRVSLRAARSLA